LSEISRRRQLHPPPVSWDFVLAGILLCPCTLRDFLLRQCFCLLRNFITLRKMIEQAKRERKLVRGQIFHSGQKKSRQKEGALAENGLHVCRTIFTTSAAFLLASRVKKVTCLTQRFFWRQKKVTPVGYIRDSTRVHPSYLTHNNT
jgi:hypothetical protein